MATMAYREGDVVDRVTVAALIRAAVAPNAAPGDPTARR